MALPDFLVVGAQRCGTTTIHNLLRQHPNIFVPTVTKETDFFNGKHRYGLFFYERMFFSEWNGERAIGEVTPAYLFSLSALEHINQDMGANIKLICTLRNPVYRAWSHYRMNYGFLWETRSFDKALETEWAQIQEKGGSEDGRFTYLRRGMYSEQIRRLFELFPRENIQIHVFEEDVIKDQQRLTDRISDFLNVPHAPIRPVHSNKTSLPRILKIDQPGSITIRNQGRSEKIAASPGDVVITGGFGRNFSITRRPSRVFLDFVDQWLENQPPESLAADRARQMYADYFEKDIVELEGLLDRSLECWRPD